MHGAPIEPWYIDPGFWLMIILMTILGIGCLIGRRRDKETDAFIRRHFRL